VPRAPEGGAAIEAAGGAETAEPAPSVNGRWAVACCLADDRLGWSVSPMKLASLSF
jgi:hypothetical protein